MKKERFTLIFPKVSTKEPIIYNMVKNYDLKINILKAEITPLQRGNLLVDIDGEDSKLSDALKYLKEIDIEVIPMEKQVKIDIDKCVHCGACVAVCFSNALSMNKETWELEFNSDNCIVCGLCLEACPVNASKVDFGSYEG